MGITVERTAALPGRLNHYNFCRRHGSLGHQPPAARLAELEQRLG
jgi:transposase InsO family protein